MKILLFISLFFMAFASMAETNQNEESFDKSGNSYSAGADSSALEKIKVTGSRIKRIDIEGPSPVVMFDSEDLQQSGYDSVADFLRDSNIAPFGVSRGTAGSASTGDSFARIKGEPALILINGLRVTDDPEIHSFDLNQIPINAVEKIEVLKDGAAALYGSDAIGGVINFITKKDFSGVKIFASLTPTLYPLYRLKLKDLKTSFDDYLAGSQASYGLVFGETRSDWSIVGALNTRYQENIRMNQRNWSKELFSRTTPQAEYVFLPESKKESVDNCKEKQPCLFDYTPYADLMPKYFQLNGFAQGEYKHDDVTLYTQILGSYKYSQYYFAPIPVSAGVKPALEIPKDHKVKEAAGEPFKVSHRFMEAGKRDTHAHYGMGDVTIGAKGYLSKIWDYDINVKGAHIIKNRVEKNRLLRDKTILAIQNGIYNPFEPSKEGLKDAVYTARGSSNSSLIFSSANFSGTAGGFNLATGFQAYFQRYANNPDKEKKASNILSAAGSDGSGNRYVGSYYLEAIKNLSSALELQLAWRADYYSDFGFTNFGLRELIEDINSDNLKFLKNWKFLDYLIGTPKIAFRFQPTPDFIFRGSVGSSFKAPELSSLYGSKSTGFPWIFDTPGCIEDLNNLTEEAINKQANESKKSKEDINMLKANLSKLKKHKELVSLIVVYGQKTLEKAELSPKQKEIIEKENLVPAVTSVYGSIDPNFNSCKPRQYFVATSSNKDLRETRAVTASLGSVLELAPGVNFNLDLNYIAKNGIATTGLEDSTGVGKKFLDSFALHGETALTKHGIKIERREDGELENVETKFLNLQKSQKLFLDFGLKAQLSNIQIHNGSPYYNNDFTFFILDKSEEFPGFGLENLIGQFGRPRWANSAVLGWQNDKHHIFIKALSTASFKKASNPSEHFPLYTRFDINYEYLISEKTSLQLNVFNFLNLGLNFEDKDASLLSVSLDTPFDSDAYSSGTRTDLDIFGTNGAYFSVRLSHLL